MALQTMVPHFQLAVTRGLALAIALSMLAPRLAAAQDETEDLLEDEPSPSVGEQTLDIEYLAWPFVGTAAGALIAMIGIAVRTSDLSNDPDFFAYRTWAGTIPTASNNVCEVAAGYSDAASLQAQGVCREATGLETAQLAMVAVAVWSAVIVVTLLIGDATRPRPEAPRASVGVGLGAMSLNVTF